VLSADAFGAFEEAGLEDEEQVQVRRHDRKGKKVLVLLQADDDEVYFLACFAVFCMLIQYIWSIIFAVPSPQLTLLLAILHMNYNALATLRDSFSGCRKSDASSETLFSLLEEPFTR
jgi:hypothetical protein